MVAEQRRGGKAATGMMRLWHSPALSAPHWIHARRLHTPAATLPPCRTRVLYTESLSNPTLVLADVPRLAELAHAARLKLVVDNTFTPVILSPLR